MGKNRYITDAQVVMRAQTAVKIELEKNKALDVPVAIYDRKKQVIIYQNSDGSEVEVMERLRRGRYSERNK